MLKLLDLFSGIGGFSLGLESTGGFETIAFVEKNEFCQKVLKKHWPNITIEGDIRNFKGEKYEADIITGGFPCQPFSVAGKRKGTDDDRYLWDETIRVVRECKPRWFIGENVEGLININNGVVLRQVQTDLEKEGFEVQCFVIPAAGIGAWHQRKRIWIMGYAKHNGRSSSSIKGGNREINERSPQRQNQTCKFERTSGSINNENVWLDVSNSNNSRDRTSQYDTNKDWEKGNKRQKEFTQFEFSGHSEDVSNTNSRFSFGEKEEIQTRGTSINFSSENVSNSNTRLRRGGRAELKSGVNKEWEFYSTQEEQTREHIRSKVIGCDVVYKQDVSNSKSISSNDRKYGNNSEEKQIQFKTGGKDCIRNLSNSNDERLQRLNSKSILQEQKLGLITNKDDEGGETWWQTQSRICGVPNGVSFTLDKDRSNRIKSLGNSIVPQIVRQFGLAILEAEK